MPPARCEYLAPIEISDVLQIAIRGEVQSQKAMGAVGSPGGQNEIVSMRMDDLRANSSAIFMQKPEQLARGHIRVDQAVHVGLNIAREIFISVQYAVSDIRPVESRNTFDKMRPGLTFRRPRQMAGRSNALAVYLLIVARDCP